MAIPLSTPPEEVYCEARARRYIGAERVRTVCDTELELWLRAERAAAREELQTRLAAIRALLLHLQTNLGSVVGKLERATVERPALELSAADVPALIAKARTVYELWTAYACEGMYGEFFRAGMDRMDFDLLGDAARELGEALKPFREAQ